jgi:uncharacterized coiled-coil protein SlyX
MYSKWSEANLNLMRLKMRSASYEDEIENLKEQIREQENTIVNQSSEICMLKSKNSRIFQESCTLSRILNSKPTEAKDYLVLSND